MGTWTDDIVEAIELLGGSGTYNQIYASVASLRPSPLPRSWKKIVQRHIQNLSSDSSGFKGEADLFFSVDGIGGGVWGLRRAVPATPLAADLSPGERNPGRIAQTTYRILRDTRLARQLKFLHRNQCQICGIALDVGGGNTYAEAHHVIPLGAEHCGPDVAENILVLCPNHHAQCDMGAIELDLSNIRTVAGHSVALASIQYHNAKIHGRPPSSNRGSEASLVE